MGDRVYERFVECPEVIEIRWVSDDPDHHRPSEDMFNCQANGIPEDYGKKDKRTTEQAHFYCCVCECQSASLKTLRAHCEVIRTNCCINFPRNKLHLVLYFNLVSKGVIVNIVGSSVPNVRFLSYLCGWNLTSHLLIVYTFCFF
jgi:hypothetical protein